MAPDFFDFNNAGEQKSFDVIPDNTIATVQLTIRPGGAGEGGWLKLSKDGASKMIDAELVVVDGPHAKRKIFQNFVISGTTQGHTEAAEISRKTFAAMLESARGIRPDDRSDTAQRARMVSGWQDFDGLRFVVRIGVQPPRNGYDARNMVREIVTPERQQWKKPEQAIRPAAAGQPAAAPANAIARPQWAG